MFWHESVCLSTLVGGGDPISGLGRRVPCPRSGGVPHLRSGGYTPSQVWWVPYLRLGGTPSQVRGVPHLRSRGFPIPGLDGGVPHPRSGQEGGTPGLDGGVPGGNPHDWMGYPPTRGGVPPLEMLCGEQYAFCVHAGGLSCYRPHPKDGGRYCFQFVSSHFRGVPQSGLGRGVPHLRSGGYPISGLGRGVPHLRSG